ncbi:hypothetical protein AB4225_35105 [Streptomyces sp. 2RAF24]|uniref:hypothetical protein n=1 Tax=Streptomyces sp. 2RAF24 TaxID=3232997 RepID=UPI003F9D0E4A
MTSVEPGSDKTASDPKAEATDNISDAERELYGAALFLQLACAGAAGTTQRSIRQIITTAGMQARMQAVSTWLTSGARPVAALLAGALGTWLGVRPALTAGTLLLLVPLVVLARSSIRALQQMPNSPGTTLPSPPAARTAAPTVPTAACTDDGQHDRSLGGDAS